MILDLRTRVENYLKGKLAASMLTERMLSILHVFKMFGYCPYYAGQEGSIRERIFHSVGKNISSELTDTDLSNQELSRLAAYYMAYTDYEIKGVPQEVLNATKGGVSVFISHSGVDKDFARKLSNDLLNEGLSVWLDEWELRFGDSLWDKIDQGIVNADFVLLLMSPESIDSRWVRKEMNAALSVEMEMKHRFVIPILYRNCDIPVFIKEKYYCNLSNSYEENIEKLVKSISQ